MKKYKVLITYVEAGMGHIVTAEAISSALEKYYPDVVEVKRCYIFSETNDKDLIDYEKFIINAVKQSNHNNFSMYLMFFILKIVSPMLALKFVHNFTFKKAKEKSMEIIKDYHPDMVISTHYAPLHFSVEAKKKYDLDYITVAYCPDPNVHTWWDNRADLFLVNNQDAYNECIKKAHFKEQNAFLGKFILRRKILEANITSLQMRQKYGLPEDNFTVVMADGAYAKANLKKFAKEFLKIDKKFTLLIIAGKNEKLYDYFNKKAQEQTKIDLRVYHFIEEAYELYKASDLFVTKAGPNAILDSVYMETPVMANFYASPIEKTTVNLYINRWQVGVYCQKAKKAKALLESYIDNPSLLNQYKENCVKFKQAGTGEKMFADRIVEELRKR